MNQQLNMAVRKLFPYTVETKNREEYKTIFKHWKQTKNHGSLEPLLIIKSNRKQPLAIIIKIILLIILLSISKLYHGPRLMDHNNPLT